ncbi:hypothetical protein B0H14DRAFT_3702551 [Mycena olivaceomarginata]|nr:hypothetical protein B0H14DRAFT_3702551 [Mycena olivaceomarginata]
MDSQPLPVVNSIATVPPPVAHPPPAVPETQGDVPAPISSSSRSMSGQTNTSFTTMLSHQETASTDSLINSLLDTSAPSTPAAKGKKPASAAALAPTPSSTATLKTAPSGKSEAAAAGIKRLDANMGAMSACIEGHIADTEDKHSHTTAHLKKLADDIAAAGHGPATTGTFTVNDMLAHPTFRALLDANNASVDAISTMRGEIRSLRSIVDASQVSAAKRKRNADDTPVHSNDVFLPAVKRITASTIVPANPLPSVALNAGPVAADAPAAYHPYPVADAPAAYHLYPAVDVPAAYHPYPAADAPAAYHPYSAAAGGVPDGPQPTPAYNTAAYQPYPAGGVPNAPPAIPAYHATATAGPSSVPDAPPSVSAHQNTAVEVGPVNWGKDISGQVCGLITRMPRANTIDANAVKDLYAKRIPKNNRYVTAFFPTNVSAIQFVNGWSNGPAPGYEKDTAVFSSGN